jgi:hypothetical protein
VTSQRPKYSTIRVTKARRAICVCGRGERNKFIEDFSGKMEYLEDLGANGKGVRM